MITPSIKERPQAADNLALPRWSQRHPQRNRPRGMSGAPYTVCALAGPYQLETHLTPDREQPTQVWFDAAVQDRAQTPALDSLLFLRVTPAAEPQRVLAGLVSLADASTGYRHQTAFRFEQPGLYRVTVSVCDPNGEGGTVTILWPHALPEADCTTQVATTTTLTN
ncbi:MAG: hypothetical protein KJZ93_14830 [Caldilineaceae bacterium]|nr:hypothetical protein [Caldilineaceae bacterium]